jgi:hypothetical protein
MAGVLRVVPSQSVKAAPSQSDSISNKITITELLSTGMPVLVLYLTMVADTYANQPTRLKVRLKICRGKSQNQGWTMHCPKVQCQGHMLAPRGSRSCGVACLPEEEVPAKVQSRLPSPLEWKSKRAADGTSLVLVPKYWLN